MSYLVDSNVLSEPTKPAPNPDVVQWLRDHEPELIIDAVVLGEISTGILLLPDGKRRDQLQQWFDRRVVRMECRPWDAAVALRWAQLQADLATAGRKMPTEDSMIAASALYHGFTVATRNVADFEKAGVLIVNPFEL